MGILGMVSPNALPHKDTVRPTKYVPVGLKLADSLINLFYFLYSISQALRKLTSDSI